MRAPRYRFPDEVRDVTRTIAARMVRDGNIARTPEELDAWISAAPDVREPLRRGGHGTAFTAHDLFPLLQVFLVQAGGPAPRVEAPVPPSRRGWVVGLGLFLAVLAVAAAMALLR